MGEQYCMAHGRLWNSRTQGLLNKLRGNIIPEKYALRFNTVICCCRTPPRDKPRLEDPFSDVSDRELKGSISYLEGYLEDAKRTDAVKYLIDMLQYLRSQFYMLEDPRSGSYKMLYLIKRCIAKDYTMLEPPEPLNAKEVIKKTTVEDHMELSEVHPDNVGILIGRGGQNISDLVRQHHCYVKVSVEGEGEDKKVVADLKLTTTKPESLDEVKAALREMAENAQRKASLATPKPVPMDYEEMTQEVLYRQSDPSHIDTPLKMTDVPMERQESFNPGHLQSAELECRVPAQHQETSLVKPLPLREVDIGQQLSSPDITSQKPGTMSSNLAATGKSVCLVHDRRWLPTYQFTLNQIHERTGLQLKDGRPFSRLVCVCDTQPVDQHFFVTQADLEKTFAAMATVIKGWSGCETVVRPVVSQLEKVKMAETFTSLMKFAYYLSQIQNQNYSCLKPDHRLPGQDSLSSAFAPIAGSSLQASSVSSSAAMVTTGIQTTAPATPSSEPSPPPATAAPVSEPLPQPVGSLAAEPPTTPATKYVRKKIAPEDRNDGCYFHGKHKYLFQNILNNLHQRSQFPTKLRLAFSQLVCCCDGKVELTDFYDSTVAAGMKARFTKNWMERGSSESVKTLQPVIEALNLAAQTKQFPDGLLKLIYYVQQAERNNYEPFNDMFTVLCQKT